MYSMPYDLSDAYFFKIATDKDENLAILLFMYDGKEKMLIFTESDGFLEATDYEHSAKLQDVSRSQSQFMSQTDYDINDSPGLLWIKS